MREGKRKYPLPKGSLNTPMLGDIRKGKELGFRDNGYRIWSKCPKCGNARWIQYANEVIRTPICVACGNRSRVRRGEEHPNWKGYSRFVATEPIVGEIRRGGQLGKNYGEKYIYTVCEKCGKQFWHSLSHARKYLLCIACIRKIQGEMRRQYYTCIQCGKRIWAKQGDIPQDSLCKSCRTSITSKSHLVTCPMCGTERWVKQLSVQKTDLCIHCFASSAAKARVGAKSHTWKGGIAKTWRLRLKQEVFSHYAHGGKIQCADPYHMHKYPIVDLDILTLDHINGDGILDKNCELYRKLKKNGYPGGIQILCWNCQHKKVILNGEMTKAFREERDRRIVLGV